MRHGFVAEAMIVADQGQTRVKALSSSFRPGAGAPGGTRQFAPRQNGIEGQEMEFEGGALACRWDGSGLKGGQSHCG